MKKSLLTLILVIVASLLSGCIISVAPNEDPVLMVPGVERTFSVKVLPIPTEFAWYVNGSLVPEATTNAYSYMMDDVLPFVHTIEVRVSDIFGTDRHIWYLQYAPYNHPPVADAGNDQIVVVGTTVTLDGTGSTDPDNNIVSYQWQQTDGPSVTLINSDTAVAQFTATVEAGAVLTFGLTVTDAGGLQATDTCVVTIPTTPINELLGSLVSIPAGTFMMGSTDNENGRSDLTTPVHEVTLQAFKIGAYEVTQAQYLYVMGTNPSAFQGTGKENNPVEWLSWQAAIEFCTQLSVLTGRTLTLPSEAQWEYACRAGTTTLYSWGDSDSLIDEYVWWWWNSDGTGGLYGTHPVGTKLPNPWGLYDMHGNVYEWCLDSWHPNYVGAPTDGSAWGPELGSEHVSRGGAWGYEHPWDFRSAIRYYYPDGKIGSIGFRVVEIP